MKRRVFSTTFLWEILFFEIFIFLSFSGDLFSFLGEFILEILFFFPLGDLFSSNFFGKFFPLGDLLSFLFWENLFFLSFWEIYS